MKPMILTQADRTAVEVELSRRSLAEYARMVWPLLEPATPLRWGWALDAICSHLEAVTSGEIRRLLMNVPPGTMKSLLTNVIWPSWEWGPKEKAHLRHIGTAHKQDLAIRDNLKCRRLIQSNWFQERWPVHLVTDQNAKTKFENDKTGFMEAMAFTGMTGSRGDRVRLDDPISAHDANSEAELQAAEIAFTETLPTRVNNDESAIVVIMQRLHERDTSGVILSKELDYVHLCLPMRFEPARRCVTRWGADPRTTEGELLFPERFPEEQVAQLEKTLGSHATAGQLQQRPAPRGGGILKTAWLRYWSVQPKLEWRYIFADTAQKTKEENDFSVFECWGRSTTGDAILLDLIRGKWEAPELLAQGRAFWLKHQAIPNAAPLRGMKVEDKVSGTGLIQTLRREGIPILPMQRDRDKVSRAHDAAPFMESGCVYIPESASWVSDFLGEVEAFPTGAHDDQIDPMLDAIREVQRAPSAQTMPIHIPPRQSLGASRRF
jgi:predicted phage terminase large subunit-like protein